MSSSLPITNDEHLMKNNERLVKSDTPLMKNDTRLIKSDEPLLKINNLSVNFPVRGNLPFTTKKYVHAVSDVSLSMKKGETFGVVGESGCGKTTLANAALGILRPTAGSVIFKNKDINNVTRKEFNDLRRDMQMIFQDPFSSLNPRFDIFSIIAEPYVIRGGLSKPEIMEHVIELLKMVGLSEKDVHRYPSEFSGGQRQRIGIARALALRPEFLVCDEPVSSLDVSVHAQILNLLLDLQKELGLTYLFISHNLAVVKNVCTSLAVMYLGKVMESGSTEAIFKNPLHPYTKALLSAVLDIDPDNQQERIVLQGEIPSPINPPKGCRFCKRCYEAESMCADMPALSIEVEPDHFVACHKYKG